jgi:hypothetical protein
MPFQIVHHIKGRLRLRWLSPPGDGEFLSDIESRLAKEEGVLRVETNPWSGSILILFQPEKIPLTRLTGLLAELSGSAILPSPVSRISPSPGRATAPGASGTFRLPLKRLTRQFEEWTNGDLDIRYLVPIGFMIYGTVKVYRQGFVPAIPWYLSYWWSYRLFSTLSQTNNK